MATTSLFTRDLSAPVPWPEVDAFLAQRHRESPGIEYRQKIDPSGKGLTPFVDTVGAMANSGGGLILIGVEADHGTDRPRRWPTLQVGEVKAQTLEAQVRGNVRPYVPIEICPSIETRGAMEVIVRVPDVWPKPVFVNESGILHRLAEANVLAPVETIRTWLTQERPSASRRNQAMWMAVGHLSGNTSPIFNILVGASRPWYRQAGVTPWTRQSIEKCTGRFPMSASSRCRSSWSSSWTARRVRTGRAVCGVIRMDGSCEVLAHLSVRTVHLTPSS
jgi:hypothetical protein